MPTLHPVPASSSLGPVYVKQDREQYAPELGETCSLTDRVFQDKSSQQKLHFQQHPTLAPEMKLVDYALANPCHVQALPDSKGVVNDYRKMIGEHVERRVLFFLQQLIVCHQTKLHFESVGAQNQGKSADAIVMIIGGQSEKYAVRQAAHSSGNPCIVAYDNTQWQQYKAGLIPKPQGFVFLKDTDYYRTVNATMNMPKWINDADREIDEKTSFSQLRNKGEAIINRSSQGSITPDEGMLEYIQEAIIEVKDARQRLVQAGRQPEVQEVLALYEKYLTKTQKVVKEDPLFLEKFLNLKMGNTTQDERSKRVILKMRYAAIRNCQINQSGLIQKIKALSQSLLAEIKTRKNRKPDNFDAAFRAALVEQARTDENRKRVETLLNFSPFNYEAQLQGAAKAKYNATKALLSAYNGRINSLAKDIFEDMRKLRTQEAYERAQTVKQLRSMRNWSQKRLGQEISKIFPAAAASQSTISRVENREKLVTEQIATEFSTVFGVDPGLFMPHFYYA